MSFQLLELSNTPIFEQLQLEEALLRVSQEEWCLINSGSPPAIVMGISGKPEELVHETDLPLIRRFTGGGCVIVDEETLFLTFIGNMDSPNPAKIHEWVKHKIAGAFKGLPFSLRENDYLIGEKKVGGNAQAITKNRFLHHTSFLYKFDPKKMSLLKMPKKTPEYRAGRDHAEFVTTLSPYFSSHKHFFDKIKKNVDHTLSEIYQIKYLLDRPHRKTLQQVNQV